MNMSTPLVNISLVHFYIVMSFNRDLTGAPASAESLSQSHRNFQERWHPSVRD